MILCYYNEVTLPGEGLGQPIEAQIDTFVQNLLLLAGQLELVRETTFSSHHVHPDYPDLYIRSQSMGVGRNRSPVVIPDMDAVQTKFDSYNRLSETGAIALPQKVTTFRDRLFVVVTQRVEGVPLRGALLENPKLAEQYDSITAKEIDLWFDIRGEDAVVPMDIYGSHQFMWGKPAGSNQEPAITYVDIEPTNGLFTDCKDFTTDPWLAASSISSIARVTITDEKELGFRMPQTHNKLTQDLDVLYSEAELEPVKSYSQEIRELLRTGSEERLDNFEETHDL